MIDRIRVWPVYPYIQTWLHHIWFVLITTLLVTATAVIWVLMEEDEYSVSIEFVPPAMEALSALPAPRVVPGGPVDMERLLSYLQSASFLGMVADSFHLEKHYEIDKISNPKIRAKRLARMVKSNIKSRVTRYSTISIKVTDKDPNYAYKIANFVLDKVREEVRFYDKSQRLYNEIASQEKNALRLIDSLQDHLSKLRRRYSLLVATGDMRLPYQVMLNNPEAFEHYDELAYLEARHRAHIQEALDLRRRRLERDIVNESLPDPLWVIEPPSFPSFPSWPPRLLIIIGAFFVGFLSSSFLVIYANYLGILPTKAENVVHMVGT